MSFIFFSSRFKGAGVYGGENGELTVFVNSPGLPQSPRAPRRPQALGQEWPARQRTYLAQQDWQAAGGRVLCYVRAF